MKIFPENVARYLKKYSHVKWDLKLADSNLYKLIVIIPAISELENIKSLLQSLNENECRYFENILVLFVINNSSDSDANIKEENRQTIKLLEDIIEKGKLKYRLNFIDASSKGLELPHKDAGVGLARKIGMDTALKYFDYKTNNKNILVCLDADCIVEENYFEEIYKSFSEQFLSAAYVKFEHLIKSESESSLAIICYEIFLRYYVLGLRYAESYYAIQTIGSTMMCDSDSYIKIEGMNKKKAAEDFYFMEKLAKITKVEEIKSTTVFPSSRPSWRVPFGTGQRVNRYLSHTQNEYQLYNPESFDVLKKWLKVFDNNYTSAKEYLVQAGRIDHNLKEFLIRQNFERDFGRIISNTNSENQLIKQKRSWFDGFKTLKLIHFLRDNGFPNVNMFDAVDSLLNKLNMNSEFGRTLEIPSFKIQTAYLQRLREIT